MMRVFVLPQQPLSVSDDGLAFSLASAGMAQPTDDKAVPTKSSLQAIATNLIPDGTVTLSRGSIAAATSFV